MSRSPLFSPVLAALGLTFCLLAGGSIAGCAASTRGSAPPTQTGLDGGMETNAEAKAVDDERPAFASTYRPFPSTPTLIENATILTGTGERLDEGAVLLQDGKVVAVGAVVAAPAGARVIDAAGRWVTPGLIDVHSHLGVYPSPGVASHQDGNELTDPVTPQVWAEHGVWPQDPGFGTALAGGVTTMQVLPGSANLFGGRGVTLKNVSSRTVQGMKFPDAPYSLKMACGENPKRFYGEKGRAPGSRMGNFAGYRAAWIRAQAYRDSWVRHEEKLAAGEAEPSDAPQRDLAMETLAGVLDGEILVHNHCYRADEMVQMLDLAREFGYRVTAFHHAVEAYKIADVLAEEGVCGALWADWWGFKMEAYDGVRENIAFVDRPEGGCAIVHSDSEYGIQRLNQEAAKAMAAGRRAGLDIPPERAIRWITANAAAAIGLGDIIGTLEPGKNADLVVWSGDPFSVYTRADQVFIDGALTYDRDDPERQPRSDFSLGQVSEAVDEGIPVEGRPDPQEALDDMNEDRAALGKEAVTHPSQRALVPPPEVIAIVGGTVHTQGDSGTLEGATVLIRDGRVEAVGPDVTPPDGAWVLDASGKIVTPGLFDSHSHVGLVEVSGVDGSRDYATDDDRITAAFRVGDALNPASTVIPIARVEGLTRALVLPRTGGSLIAGQGAVVHFGTGPGDGADAMLVREPAAMYVAFGETGAGYSGGSRAAALLKIREALDDARDYAAHRDAYARGERRGYALSRLDLEALVPVVEGRLPLVVAAERASDLLAVLRLRDDFPDLLLVLADAEEAWLVADKIAEAGVPVLLSPLSNLPSTFQDLGATLANAARLHRAGVPIAFMSGGAHQSRNLRQDAGNAVAHGLPWEAALAAMTNVPAAIWGMPGEVGCLEVGCEADLVVWDGDPLEVTTYPEHVFIRGREMPRETRQLLLRDRYRNLADGRSSRLSDEDLARP